MIDENRWRAGRYGIDGKMIDFGKKREVEERELLHELIEFVAPEVNELGTEEEIVHIESSRTSSCCKTSPSGDIHAG